MENLTFKNFRVVNVKRSANVFPECDDWTPTDWACAVAGEVGEACNFIKKMRRGEEIPIRKVADELADALIYIDLLAERLGIDLEEAVVDKFNQVSGRYGTDIKLG